MPQVSVCVPSYNHSKFIKELIESVLSQTFTDFELIICDDASTDSSVEIIKSFNDRRIRFYQNEKNLGIVETMNRCISLAQGEFINIIGSDDAMLPNNLLKKVEFLKAHPYAGIVYSDIDKIDEGGQLIGHIWGNQSKTDTILDKTTAFKRLIQEGNFLCHSAALLRKQCHDQVGIYDERFRSNQDYDMWLRISLHYDVGYMVEPLIKYRWHQNNITRDYVGEHRLKGKDKDYLARKAALEQYHQFAQGKIFTDNELAQIYCEFGQFSYWTDDLRTARGFFLKALKHNSFSIKIFIYIILSLFPVGMIHFLRHLKNILKREK